MPSHKILSVFYSPGFAKHISIPSSTAACSNFSAPVVLAPIFGDPKEFQPWLARAALQAWQVYKMLPLEIEMQLRSAGDWPWDGNCVESKKRGQGRKFAIRGRGKFTNSVG